MNDKSSEQSIDYLWPFIGLGLGTAIMSVLVLSTDPAVRLLTGLVVGGLPCGALGLWYAYRRALRR